MSSGKTCAPKSMALSRARGVTSIHNIRERAILTSKVVPKNPETYLEFSPKNPGTETLGFSS